MEHLKLPYYLMEKSGLFMPKTFSKGFLKIPWIIYSIVVNGIAFLTPICMIILLLQSKNSAEFFERLFVVPSGFSCIFKSLYVVWNRKQILETEKKFLVHFCIFKSNEERNAGQKYYKIARLVDINK